MIAVLQRVSSARVSVETGPGAPHDAQIGRGLVALVAVEGGDTASEADWLADKIAALRIFPDDAGKMNRSVSEIGGDVLVISQFTLVGETSKGNRPSFARAEAPAAAAALVDRITRRLQAERSLAVKSGVFGASMRVSLTNEGPVTMIVERRPPGRAVLSADVSNE